MLRASSLRLAGLAFLMLGAADPAFAGHGGPVQSQAVTSSGGGGSVPAEPGKERKICRKLEVTQSRMGANRVCKTAAEWRQDQQNGNGLDDLKQNGSKGH